MNMMWYDMMCFREYQTLPGRFRPEMFMSTSGGFLLTGIYIGMVPCAYPFSGAQSWPSSSSLTPWCAQSNSQSQSWWNGMGVVCVWCMNTNWLQLNSSWLLQWLEKHHNNNMNIDSLKCIDRNIVTELKCVIRRTVYIYVTYVIVINHPSIHPSAIHPLSTQWL